MSGYLSEDVRDALKGSDRNGRNTARHRLTIHVGGEAYPVLRVFDQGFEVDRETTPQLRGLVDIFDGPRYVAQALIVATGDEHGVATYEYKRATRVADGPPLDFARRDRASNENPGPGH